MLAQNPDHVHIQVHMIMSTGSGAAVFFFNNIQAYWVHAFFSLFPLNIFVNVKQSNVTLLSGGLM